LIIACKFDAAGLPVQPHNGHREGESAGQVHHQRPQRVALRLVSLRVADQQERAERGDFPKEEQPHQVVGENEAEHRAHEDEQQREEKRTPVRNVAMRHGVVFAHVAQRVNADAAAHQAVDQGHDHGELVHEQILRHLQMLALRYLEPNHQPRLGQRQRHDQRAFRAHTDVNDENAHPDLDELHAQVDPMGFSRKLPTNQPGWAKWPDTRCRSKRPASRRTPEFSGAGPAGTTASSRRPAEPESVLE
jgi:hypothetical protein